MKKACWMAWMALCLAAGPMGCGGDGDQSGDGDNGDGDNGDGDNGGDGDQSGDGDHGGDGDSPDNEAACNNWKQAVSCEGADLSILNMLDCSTYDSYACDISAYFDCLTENTKCNGSVLDVSGWTGCQNLAVCK